MALLALEYPRPLRRRGYRPLARRIVLDPSRRSSSASSVSFPPRRRRPSISTSPASPPLPIVIIRVINTINSFHRRHRDRALRLTRPFPRRFVDGRRWPRAYHPLGRSGSTSRPRTSSAHVGARTRRPPASLERKIMLAVSRPAVAPSARARLRARRASTNADAIDAVIHESPRGGALHRARERLGRARRGRAAFDRRRVEIGGRRERVVVGGDDV